MKKLLPLLLAALALPAAATPPAREAFDFGAELAVAGMAGAEPLAGLPVPVRLAEDSPQGFSYAQLHDPATGADLAFVGADGVALPFDVDTWNTNGESLAWVRLPVATNGASFTMLWGSELAGRTLCPDDPWEGYAGVWHLGVAGAGAMPAADASAGALAGTTHASSVPVAGGRFGGARGLRVTGGNYKNGPVVSVPAAGTAIDALPPAFTVSGWFRPQTRDPHWAYLFSRKNDDAYPAWGVQFRGADGKGGFTALGLYTDGTLNKDSDRAIIATPGAFASNVWTKVDVVFDGGALSLYTNGVLAGAAESKPRGNPAASGSLPFSIGGLDGTAGTGTFDGDVDEVRLYAGTAPAARIAADFAAQADPAFLSAGAAEANPAGAGPAVGFGIASVGYGDATVVVHVRSPGAGATRADVTLEVSRSADFARILRTESYSAGVGETRAIAFSGLISGWTHYVRVCVENDRGESAALPVVVFTTRPAGAPTGTAALLPSNDASLSAVAAVQDFGAGGTSARARLEVSTAASFATIAAMSAWMPAPRNASVRLSVGGLESATDYHVRVRFENEWGAANFVDLGPATTGREVYVDSLAAEGGDGRSPATALRTIREGVEAASARSTVWVRGGADRAYLVSSDAEAIAIPAEKEQLAIRAYTDTPGDGGRAALSVSDTYVLDGNSAHVVSNGASDVTISGFVCSYGPHSIGAQNYAQCRVVAVAAPRFTLADCEFFCTGVPGFSGAGSSGVVAAIPVAGDWHAAAAMTIERCFFHDTVGYRGDTANCLLFVADDTTVRQCVFTNTWVLARDPGPGKTKFRNFTFVSNVVCAGRMNGDASYFTFGGKTPSYAFFTSGYGGLGAGAEIAYNVFVGTGDPDRGVFAFTRYDGFGGSQRVHHNVFANLPWIWGYSRDGNPTGKTVAEFFDNVVELSAGGSVVRDEGFDGETVRVGTPLFIAGSFSRCNALVAPAAFWGGASALAEEGYDRSVVDPLDDIALAVPPDWIETDAVFHADFYRYRARRGPGDLGFAGWRGENGELPTFVGAKSPLYPLATLMLLR